MTDIAAALSILRPGAQWALSGNDYDGLVWLDAEQSTPTREEIESLPEPPPPRDLLAELRAAWAQFPDALRPQFAVHFSAVRNLVQADMRADARDFVAGLDLPAELETYRADILARLE
jgi:hypothetical protein